MKQNKTFLSLIFFFLAGILSFSAPLYAKKIVLKIFHAGSLSVPFSKIEKAFEKKYPYIDVRREASGSVQAIRKITDLHKPCDVVAVADYTLIPKMLFPHYTDYVKLFARNELVLCYTKHSKYAKVINSKNWYDILNKKGVKWGFSNPNDDPCGYRAVIAIGLASLYYKNPLILKNLLDKNTNLKWRKKGNGIIFYVPENLKFNTEKLAIRPKSVELLGLLETGAIDYAFEYKSVALQHKLLFIKLPKKLNLGAIEYRKFYRRCKIKLANGKVISGKPIVYGITVLKNAPHPEEAKLWEKFVTSEKGRNLLLNSYQIPVFPAKVIKVK